MYCRERDCTSRGGIVQSARLYWRMRDCTGGTYIDFNIIGNYCCDRGRDFTGSRQDCDGSKGFVLHCKALKCCWTFYTEMGADLYWQGRNCWTVNIAVGTDLY